MLIIFKNGMICFFLSETWEKTLELSESVKDCVLQYLISAKSVANKMDYACCHFTSFEQSN